VVTLTGRARKRTEDDDLGLALRGEHTPETSRHGDRAAVAGRNFHGSMRNEFAELETLARLYCR
jgi:hypothetical protein